LQFPLDSLIFDGEDQTMMLRWMLSNFVRQAAYQKVSDAIAAATEQVSGAERDKESTEPLPPCEIALLFATNLESEDFAARLQDRVTTRCASFVEHSGRIAERGVVVAETGAGQQASGRAAEDLIAMHHPAWIVSAGFAAALRPELRRGHILMADQVADPQGNHLAVGFRIEPEVVAATRHLHVGRLLTVQQPLRTPEARRDLGERFDALAADMETLAVAQACSQHKVRFLSVRVITDAVDDRLPVEVERLLAKSSWAAKLGAATGALLKRPSSVKDWWHLQQQALQASDRLAKFLSGVLPQLTTSPER
jgi:adenosylhomocysteine nucleosidase